MFPHYFMFMWGLCIRLYLCRDDVTIYSFISCQLDLSLFLWGEQGTLGTTGTSSGWICSKSICQPLLRSNSLCFGCGTRLSVYRDVSWPGAWIMEEPLFHNPPIGTRVVTSASLLARLVRAGLIVTSKKWLGGKSAGDMASSIKSTILLQQVV